MPLYNPGETPEIPTQIDSDPVIDTSAVQESPTVSIPTIMDIEGEPWSVTYYHQLRVEGETARPLDPGLDPTQQQYEQVNQFQISVSSNLTSDTDPETQQTVVTGEAYVYPHTLVPHYGDMFVGHIEAGREGIFTITNVRRVSLYRQAVYEITYKLWSEDNPTYRADLNAKAVKHAFFDARRLQDGQPPIVSYQTANRDRYFNEALGQLVGQLYEEFFHYRLETFTVQTAHGVEYDPWAIQFFNKIIGRRGRHHYPDVKEYSVFVKDEHLSTALTLWDAILCSDEGLLGRVPRALSRESSSRYVGASIHRSAAMAGIDRVWMPSQWNVTVDQLTETPYVVSHACYTHEVADMSPLELSVWDIVSGRQLDLEILRDAIDTVDDLTGWEKLHRLILLIGLLRITMGVRR